MIIDQSHCADAVFQSRVHSGPMRSSDSPVQGFNLLNSIITQVIAIVS